MSILLLLSLWVPVFSPAQVSNTRDLTQLDLEDLMNVQITSVSKREEKVSAAGAAIYVINQEDIRRSGATNIPDLLRMVPGVHVAQINSHTWAISIRGFTDKYGDKVLVMIDGRSVYSPVSSGVNWDQQDVHKGWFNTEARSAARQRTVFSRTIRISGTLPPPQAKRWQTDGTKRTWESGRTGN